MGRSGIWVDLIFHRLQVIQSYTAQPQVWQVNAWTLHGHIENNNNRLAKCKFYLKVKKVKGKNIDMLRHSVWSRMQAVFVVELLQNLSGL